MDLKPSSSWQPLLHGEPAASARAAVADIVAAVRALPDDKVRRSAQDFALLEAYAAAALGPSEGGALERFLDLATDAVAAQPMTPALWGGFLGVAFAVE